MHDLPNLKPKIDLELEQMARRAERGKNIDSNVREGKTTAAFGELLQAKREDIL